jgi:hypothetical protein
MRNITSTLCPCCFATQRWLPSPMESGCEPWPVPSKTRMSVKVLRGVRPGHRSPEVIVKVISPGSNCLRAIRQHFGDLQKGHSRALETDFFNTPVVGHKAVRELIDDWDLDLDELLCCVTHL